MPLSPICRRIFDHTRQEFGHGISLDLLGKLRRSLGAALARREQVAVRVLDQDRPTASEINIHELAKAVRNLEGERAPVLCLLGWHDEMANATGPSPNDMPTEMERGEILRPQRRI